MKGYQKRDALFPGLMHIYTSMLVCKYASGSYMQVCKYASMQVCKYASMRVWEFASKQVYICLYKKVIIKRKKNKDDL